MKSSRLWLWLFLLVPVALGTARLTFDVEILNLLPDKLSVARGLKVYQQNFSNARELIVTLQAPTAEEAENGARSLAELLRAETNLVAEVTWQPGWLENPAQATELIAALWLNQPPTLVAALADRLAVTNLTNVLAEAREQLTTSFSPDEIGMRGYDPFGLMRLPESVSAAAPSVGKGEELFTSADGTFRLLFVESKFDITSYRACRVWLANIQGVIRDAQVAGKLEQSVLLNYTGRPAFVTEIAGGMENDMAGSAGGTLATIGILFWLTHRRLRPLLLLLSVLVMILAATTALGGLVFGTLNVVSMGFASILLGLAEDFGIIIYQESRSHPELTTPQLRREIEPGIFWSAVTTAGAFLVLNLSVLPGLRQLGSLVAIGIIVGAVVMLYLYLPVLLRLRRPGDLQAPDLATRERFLLFAAKRLLPARAVWMVSVVLLLASTVALAVKGPRFDHSPNVLKPKHSQANAALEQIKARFGRTKEPMWLLIPGKNEVEVAQKLDAVTPVLQQAVSNRAIGSFTLPTAIWPQPGNQRANRSNIGKIVEERSVLRAAASGAGFTPNALVATETILDHWVRALASTNVFWPTNRASRWVLNKIVAHQGNGFLALGLVHPVQDDAEKPGRNLGWAAGLEKQDVILSGWELLGTVVFDMVVRELPMVIVPILVLVLISLWLAFRNFREVVLSLLTLVFAGVLLWAAMGLLDWDWNILNLMAIPLLLGMGVDFSIHIQLSLRRYAGDLLAVRRSVGRALLLAGATTVAGFGSLGFSTNAGMASLGKVCALGLAIVLMVAVHLLPVWWRAWINFTPGATHRSVGQ